MGLALVLMVSQLWLELGQLLLPSHVSSIRSPRRQCNILVTTVGLGLYIEQVSFILFVVPFFLAPLLPSNPPFSRALFLSLSVLLYLMLFINVPTSQISVYRSFLFILISHSNH